MKFRKYLVLILTLILSVGLVGCANQNTEAAVANNLEKNVSKLSTVITILEDIEYEDIVIDDISPLGETQTQNVNYYTENTNKKTNLLQKTKIYQVGNNKNIAISAPKHDPNAKYVSKERQKNDLQKRPQKRLLKNPKQIDANKNIQNCENGECETYCQDGNCYYVKNTHNQENGTESNKYDIKKMTSNTSNNNYFTYTTRRYTPKYVNETSESFSRNQLDIYLENLENVYDSCADCISCSAEFKIEEAKLMQNMKDCKTYCSKLRDGTIKLSESEIAECNQCLKNLSSCVARLKSTKGNITSKASEIEKLKENFGNKLTDLKGAYQKLLNALDTRLEYVKECNQNINCIFNIINKSNVNIKEAEKNKSNEEDIIHNQEMIENENRERDYAENFDNSELNNKQNNLQNTTSQTKKNIENKTKNQNYSTTKVETKKPTKITKVIKENVNNNQDVYNRNLPQQNQNNTQPILNNNQNFVNNGYQYGYGYQNGYYGPVLPYGNSPAYPPRNIDTYRNIIKNTDTYRPNYVPNTNQNGINDSTERTETYIIEEDTTQNDNEKNVDNIENNTPNNKSAIEANTNIQSNLNSQTDTKHDNKSTINFDENKVQINKLNEQKQTDNNNNNEITNIKRELKNNQKPTGNQENNVKNAENNAKNSGFLQNFEKNNKNYETTKNMNNEKIKIKSAEDIQKERDEKIKKYGDVKPIIEELKNN